MDKCVNYNVPSGIDAAQALCELNDGTMSCEYNEDEGTCWDSELTASAKAWEVVINLGTLIGLLTSCHAIIFAGGMR